MHKMVEMAEQEEMNSPIEKDSDEESIDLQMDPDELASDDDIPVDEMKFSDFFKGVSKGKGENKGSSHKAELFNEDSEEESEGEKATKFEKKQVTMSKMIEQLEEENVSAKPWTMMGEAAAWNRPKDSLLEEDLEFDHASKPVPVVTVEVTQSLEQMIQQRILDQNFNDVVKPAKEKLKPRFNSDEVELDTEKAKQSLAQVYEDEYRKATSQPGQADEVPPEVQQAHQEIETLFQSVCFKLDALANCHYAPKMPKIEVQVVQDLPAIAMEEKIPLAVSDATLLAPEEVFAQAHHGQAGKIETSNELSQEERNRLRNRKKRLAKARSKNSSSSAPKPSSAQA
ncbi:U3 snoRNP protein [Entomophthora muscae]|uniref:U3 snoRNP protein n=1 Tax=Entomophthora muscae TaxID=34485 RepID=A0ACC2UF34_9FUNG|nr:U3 snoRNP protein [Entomophthora muscae]